MSPPECPNPPCAQAMPFKRMERDVAIAKADIGDTRDRLRVVEQHQEVFAVAMDRLGDYVQRLELAVARLDGAIEVLVDRPSVVVNQPPERSHAASLELGNGTWKLRARGLLPMVLLLVIAAAVAVVWSAEHWR